MEMVCRILGPHAHFIDVVHVRVPGIYGPAKGRPLPARMALLVRPAATALEKVYGEIAGNGGHVYISDMFRSTVDQQRAYQDYMIGRKPAYSPPPCASVHEAARAIDIDPFDTGIGHRRVREILRRHGWTNIVESLCGPECWHYEFRQHTWQEYHNRHGYQAMAHAMKLAIGNTAGLVTAQTQQAAIAWLQEALAEILGRKLPIDGVFGPQTREAVREFQRQYGLQADGVAGPITRNKISTLIGKDL